MWDIEGARFRCQQCGASAPIPCTPCECVAETAATPSNPTDDYRQHYAASLATIERHALHALAAAKPGTPPHLNCLALLLKVVEHRHTSYLRHQEAEEIDRLSAALEEINAHLAGHATASGVGENETPAPSEGSGTQ